MFDPENPKDLGNLIASVEWSQQKLKPFKEQDVDHIRQMVGYHYGDDGSPEQRPINMIELGVNIFRRGLTSFMPQTMIEVVEEELTPSAADLEGALNTQITRLGLKEQCDEVVVNAMFRMGMMEVGITASDSPPDSEGWQYDPGQLFADAVGFADCILDMRAKRWEQWSYIGHEFDVPLDWVKSNRNYDKKARDKIKAGSESSGGASTSDTKPETISRGSGPVNGDFEESVTLRQLYLPRHRLVIILDSSDCKYPLQIIDWEGPERGPYHCLGFGKVPGNIIPLAPIPMWFDLDDLTNKCFNKSSDDALRAKTILGVPGTAREDGDRITNARSGSAIYMEDPGACREYKFGGANQETLAMVMWCKQMLSYVGGNWDALGGLGAMSKTVGQDEMLTQGASGRMAEMQQTLIEFQSKVVEDLGFWLWTDPISEYRFTKRIAGTGFTVPGTWSPEKRNGDFKDYKFSINQYSAVPPSPRARSEAFRRDVLEVLLPLAPVIAQQGMQIDFEYIVKQLGRLSHQPELERAVIFTQPQNVDMRAKPDSPKMPTTTTRNYVRENRPSATQSGQEKVMMSALMGGNPQESEMESLARPTS